GTVGQHRTGNLFAQRLSLCGRTLCGFRKSGGAVAVTTCLSVATLDNLMAILSTRGQRMFMATPLLSPSTRVLERALALGHTGTRVAAPGPEVSDLVRGLEHMVNQGQI
ncbi:MAG: hypothetical protein AAGF46_01330, partial [Pseudomonadota bacterium]